MAARRTVSHQDEYVCLRPRLYSSCLHHSYTAVCALFSLCLSCPSSERLFPLFFLKRRLQCLRLLHLVSLSLTRFVISFFQGKRLCRGPHLNKSSRSRIASFRSSCPTCMLLKRSLQTCDRYVAFTRPILDRFVLFCISFLFFLPVCIYLTHSRNHVLLIVCSSPVCIKLTHSPSHSMLAASR